MTAAVEFQSVSRHFGSTRAVDGVDLSSAMVAQAQASGLYRRVTQGDLLSALQQQASMPVDLIVAADVFIYVGALDEVMAAARACRNSAISTSVIRTTATAAPKGQLPWLPLNCSSIRLPII